MESKDKSDMTKYYINPHIKKGKINEEQQGHFSENLGRCIYDGIFVKETSRIPNKKGMRTDIVEALRKIKVPVLRWPGGCFADIYHWEDGIGPAENRAQTVNSTWGGVLDDNSFGTDEYMQLCSQIGCKTYISGNLGSGTIREMSQWLEYMTQEGTSKYGKKRVENGYQEPYHVDYFGIGNESWGGGGNMTAAYYADEYRRYQTYMKNFNQNIDMKLVAVGASDAQYKWTEEILKEAYLDSPANAHGFMDGLSLHYYTIPGTWENKGSATDFDEDSWYTTMHKAVKIEKYIQHHGEIMNRFDPEKKIGIIVDEWGTWLDPEPGTNPAFLYQQNTMRDALVAGISLNIFQKHCDRVKMANIAQLVNVLQAVILTDGEEMILTPTYHVFDLYKVHQGNTLVESTIEQEEIGTTDQVVNITESVSESEEGFLYITLTNQSLEETYSIEAFLAETLVESVSGRILAGEKEAHNIFGEKDHVKTEEFSEIEVQNNKMFFSLPPCCVLQLTVEIKDIV